MEQQAQPPTACVWFEYLQVLDLMDGRVVLVNPVFPMSCVVSTELWQAIELAIGAARTEAEPQLSTAAATLLQQLRGAHFVFEAGVDQRAMVSNLAEQFFGRRPDMRVRARATEDAP